MHEMVELDKYPISRALTPFNSGIQWFYNISKFLQNAYVVPRDTKDYIFYFMIILTRMNLICDTTQSGKSRRLDLQMEL